MADERIQKIIAAAGLMSRRAAEEKISQGKVTVNGYTACLGDKADLAYDTICVDGVPVSGDNKKIYIMLHKPKGYVTTLSDEKDRPIVTQLVEDLGERVFPVGRLDMDTEGLLLLTNDGEFANHLAHPSSNFTKTYLVYVGGENIPEKVELLQQPIVINGKRTVPAKAELVEDNGSNAYIRVSICEGRNRQVRRLCEHAGLKVKGLKRTGYGPLSLGSLKCGAWRKLTHEELEKLK